MDATYPVVLPKVLAHEGGFVNHPADPGGATNRGVTKAVYDRFRRSKGLSVRSVKLITDDEVATIYRAGYWEPILGDLLPAGVDYATFDAAVNSGVSRGSKWLQRAVGAKQDGRIGRIDTIPRAHAADPVATVKAICRYRLSFMQGLRIWKTFGKGWARRVAAVEVLGVQLAMKAVGAQPDAVAGRAKAEAQKAETAKVQANKGAAASGAGAATSGAGSATDMAAVPWQVFAALAVFLAIIFAACLWRAHVQKARARAYREAEKG